MLIKVYVTIQMCNNVFGIFFPFLPISQEIQDRIRILELYARDRQFADFVRQHQTWVFLKVICFTYSTLGVFYRSQLLMLFLFDQSYWQSKRKFLYTDSTTECHKLKPRILWELHKIKHVLCFVLQLAQTLFNLFLLSLLSCLYKIKWLSTDLS